MTSSSLLTLAVLALTAIVSPFSLIVFSLVLATDRGPRNGAAFILGWIVTVVLIGTVMIVVGGAIHVPTHSGSRKWFLALQLALGTVLILLWLRRRFRPRRLVSVAVKPGKTDAWLAATHRDDGLRRRVRARRRDADVAGDDRRRRRDRQAAHLVRAGDGVGRAVPLVTTAGIDVLEVLAVRSPGTAAERLDRIRRYVDTHRDTVINWLYLFGGLLLAYQARSASSDARRPPLTEVGGA